MSKVNCKDCSQEDCAYYGMNNKTNCKDFVLKAQPANANAGKPWVGLTDEDISKMPSWIYSPDQDGMTAEEGLEVFARAIEAKLREKNT